MRITRRSARLMGPVIAVAASMLATTLACGQTASSTSFTYQGELTTGGSLASGVHDFTFTPFASATALVPLGPSICLDDVNVDNGRFTVKLPISVPNDRPLFLQVAVRSNSRLPCSNATDFTTLSPRQEVTPAPTAVYALAIREVAPTIRGSLRLTDAGSLQIFDGTAWRIVTETVASLPPTYTDARTYATSGTTTFTVPAGVTTLYFAAWGGSGAGGWVGPGVTVLPGGCSSATNFASAGGGGAPGRRVVGNFPVTPGETLTIIVGDGGTPATNADGGAGQTTFIRRGTTNVLVVPGGGGGRRPTATIGMGPANIAPSCSLSSGNVGAAGGTAGAAPQLLGGGTLADLGGGNDAGLPGRGPSCYTQGGFGGPDTFSCDAKPGEGTGGGDLTGNTPQFPVPLTFPGPGPSGRGGTATSLPTAGNDGRVTLFWM